MTYTEPQNFDEAYLVTAVAAELQRPGAQGALHELPSSLSKLGRTSRRVFAAFREWWSFGVVGS